MSKLCDNKSVGILVWKDGKLLMIERKKYNFGYAIPAGHQDGLEPRKAAETELSEEVGLWAESLEEKLVKDLPNPCKREGGTHHEWTIFEAQNWNGEIKAGEEEVKSYLWADKETVSSVAAALEEFVRAKNIPLDLENLPRLVKATNEDPSWQQNPGLEPPLYFLFKKLGLVENAG